MSHTCADCGATFTPARADAAYCSSACRQRAYRTRNAKPVTATWDEHDPSTWDEDAIAAYRETCAAMESELGLVVTLILNLWDAEKRNAEWVEMPLGTLRSVLDALIEADLPADSPEGADGQG